jgi:phosphatidylglycerophosphate synthase
VNAKRREMEPFEKHSPDDFGGVERPIQESFARFRTRKLGPWLMPLRRLGLKADHVTLAGLILLIPYGYFFTAHPVWAVGFLLGSVLLDGLDGVFARATGTANAGGAFTDVCADQVGVVVTALLLIHHQLVLPVLGAYYALIYVTMVALSVWQNSLGVPLQIVIRSKYPLYAFVAAWALADWNGFAWLMGFFSVTMTWSSVQSFFRLKRHFARVDRGETTNETGISESATRK